MTPAQQILFDLLSALRPQLLNLRTQVMQLTSDEAKEVIECLGRDMADPPEPIDAAVQAVLDGLAVGLTVPNMLALGVFSVFAQRDERGEAGFTTINAFYGEHEVLAFSAWNMAQKYLPISVNSAEYNTALNNSLAVAAKELNDAPASEPRTSCH